MLTYTLRQLEYFIATADAGSIAGAAARLNVAQPSVSTALAKLEDQLGLQLFIRQHAQGVALTPGGRHLHRAARDLLRLADELAETARSAGSAVGGHLALGCFLTLGPLFMPPLVTAFRDQHRHVTIDLKEGIQHDLIDGLETGAFDLALLYDIDLPETIDVTPLARFAPYVLLPEDHPLSGEAEIPLARLAGEPFVLLDVPPSRGYFLGLFEAAGVEPQIAFSSPSLEMVRGLVGQGIGFSMLVTRPQGDLTYDGHKIVTRSLAGDPQSSTVSLARLEASRPTRLMDAFVEFCETWFAQYH